MIKVDEYELRRLEDERRDFKNLFFMLLVVFIIVVSASAIYYGIAPYRYCKSWGGVMYENNVCYITKNMDLCIDNEGYITNSPFKIPRGLTNET